MKLSDQMLALIVTFIWGTNFVLIEVGLESFPPFLFASLRFFLTAFPLLLIFPRPKASWPVIAAYGVLIGFGQFGLLFWAIRDNITPGLASLVVQVQVFFTILLAAILLSEKVRRIQWFALSISFLGLCVIAAHIDGQTTLLGLAVVLIAALSWAGGNLIIKIEKPAEILGFIVWSAICAVPFLLAMSFFLDGSARMSESVLNARWSAWGVVVWQAVGNTLIGYGLWNLILNRYSAAVVTPWALLVPVFGMAASAIWLGEALPLWKWVAGSLILIGLLINGLAGSQKLRTN